MTDYYSALRALTDETWNSLNVDDKISLLQSVENEVAAREGRQPCQVTGEFIHSSDKGITLGYYNQSTRGLTINTEQLVTQSKYDMRITKPHKRGPTTWPQGTIFHTKKTRAAIILNP